MKNQTGIPCDGSSVEQKNISNERNAWNSRGKLGGQKQGTQSHCHWESEVRSEIEWHTQISMAAELTQDYKYPAARRGGTYYPVWETLECCRRGGTGHYLDFNTSGIWLEASSDVDDFKTCWITLAAMFLKTLSRLWPHAGNQSRRKPGKAVLEKAHESSVRRLSNDWWCGVMDRLSWETSAGVGGGVREN